jgi:hypothetical protein
MSVRRIMILVGSLAGALITFTAPALAAEGPGWELFAKSSPTNFARGGVDETQEVTASEESGTFTLSYEGVATNPIKDHATDAEAQSELEALSSIGGANVTVTGSTQGKFSVRFVNVLGNMKVAELGATGAGVSVTTEGLASGTIGVDVFNIGAAPSNGTITVTDTLPGGVKAKEAGALLSPGFFGTNFGVAPALEPGVWDCTGNGPGPTPHVAGASVVTCVNDPTRLPYISGGGGTLTFGNEEAGNREPTIGIAVEAEQGAPERTKAGVEGNHVSIAGGGAAEPASTVDPVTISKEPAKGGLTAADAWLSNADGTVDRQAGSHPYAATFVFSVAIALKANHEGYIPGGEIRNLETEVPPGLIGDLHTTTQCTRPQLFHSVCPPASMVGRLTAHLLTGIDAVEQVYNMVPSPGVPAELGFNYAEVPVYIGFNVKTGGDYAIVAHVNDIPQKSTWESILTLWGVPGDSSHGIWRFGAGGCGHGSGAGEMEGPPFIGETRPNYCRVGPGGGVTTPFLTLPTSCAGPQPFAFRELNGWEEPNARSEVAFVSHDANDNPAGFTGCEALAFEPRITTSPDTAKGDTPAGLTVEVKPPLGGLEAPGGLGSADIENTTVALPVGLVINPGQAAGLQACGSAEAGLTTEAEKAKGEENDRPAGCPNASKVGTVTINSPLIEANPEKQFEGNVYVLQSNPPELRLLVAASADGVNLKLVGETSLCESAGEVLHGKSCEAPGQIITTFRGTPQLPFTRFRLSFSGGPQAALDTPTQCGTYTASADFTPWSSPFTADFFTSAGFALSEGPAGSACPPSPLPFVPSLVAGATTDQAGGFTNFSLLLQRGDGQQRIERLQFKAPAGLGGMLSTVPLCGEPQAQAGTCSSVSRIGHASVASGPGPYPLVLPQPGEPELPIYLTGPYGGAPFGLSIVTPVLAGPFDLGTIVTRAKIEIDPHTAQITVTTDPLPQVVHGVPTDLRLVDAVIDRPGFMFNPTNCDPQEFSGTAWGTPPPGAGGPGATAPISSRFGVGSCRGLEFAPKFSVSTSGRNSKANGASLTAKVSYPNAAQGTQANIGLVKVELPKQLPSRLTTLQKACTLAQFEANPAGCPPASFIGHATVHTPELPVPLTGPAIFVSHGGEAFPTLTMVLQGDGVTIDLVGSTFIDKAGITSTTFKTVPDAPFSTFELTLPQGPSSALATNVPAKANYSLCGQKLTMPTEFVGQNGAVIRESTPVGVTGCAKTRALTRAQKLALALKACRHKYGKNGRRRMSCERAARRRYGAPHARRKGRK